MGEEELSFLEKSIGRIHFLNQSRISQTKKNRLRNGIKDTSNISYYDELKLRGGVKALECAGCKEIKRFLQ